MAETKLCKNCTHQENEHCRLFVCVPELIFGKHSYVRCADERKSWFGCGKKAIFFNAPARKEKFLLCTNCVHHKKEGYIDFCHYAPEKVNLVTGETKYHSCEEMRKSRRLFSKKHRCGKKGKFHQWKPMDRIEDVKQGIIERTIASDG